jgi:Flp pilus assembly protein CpaB
MKSKTMILMVVAVGCGLVASFLTSRLLAERGKTPDGPVMKKFLVAKKSLPVGTVLKEPEKYFEEREFPDELAPKKGVESFESVKNQKLTKPISADAPLSKEDILGGDKADFSQAIPVGYQALAIKVQTHTIAGGFVRPMEKVDVIWTMNRSQEALAMTILQNVLVLATDLEDGREGEKAKIASTVTLAVKPDEAQKLTLAASQGELCLKLRKYGDEEIHHTRQITVQDLIKSRDTNTSPGDPDDPAETRTPTKTTKPVIDVQTPTDPAVVKEEERYFVQTFHNGATAFRVKYPLNGKDEDTKVERSDPPVGPKDPVKKPEPGNTTDKPKGATKSEKKNADDY